VCASESIRREVGSTDDNIRLIEVVVDVADSEDTESPEKLGGEGLVGGGAVFHRLLEVRSDED